MRIAYLECFSGISGDMFMGALIDAGVPRHVFEDTVAALNLGARLEISKVDRSGISATKVDVWVGGEKDQPREEHHRYKEHRHGHTHERAHERVLGEAHSHTHEHTHAHEHSHAHDHHHDHSHEHGHAHDHGHRGLKEIRDIISAANISADAKQRALAIFQALGKAEARIHNTDIEKIHFHEVGAVDAIVDIVCAAVGFEALGVDELICSPLNVGGGTVKCAHGSFPVPAPATLELLKDAPLYSGEIQKELVTPTGAAIVKTLASRFERFPQLKAEKTGYGAGTQDFKNHPNVTRLTIGEALDAADAASSKDIAPTETIAVLEANLDDLNPQVFGYVMERALAAGALDVFGTPVQMKKSRPGMLLTVLCKPDDTQKLTKLLFAETTTLGIRMRDEKRQVLARRHVNVQTPWGEVRLKVANLNGTVANYAPEYEDCRRIAEQHQIPLKQVMQEALRIYLESQNG